MQHSPAILTYMAPTSSTLAPNQLLAGCDESYEGAGAFCIAGYLGSATQWAEVERQWHSLLGREGIVEIHMSPLVRRSGIYSAWDRPQSERVQSEVHGILLTSNLRAHVIVIDLRAWRRYEPQIQ